MKVTTVILKSGLEIVGENTTSDPFAEALLISRPLVVGHHSFAIQQQQAVAVQSMPYFRPVVASAAQTLLRIEKSDVLLVTEASKQFSDVYIQQTTGLVVAK